MEKINEIGHCPLCGWDAKITHLPDIDYIKCILCGEFKIVGSLLSTVIPDKDKSLLPYLSAYTRQASERHETVILDTRNWRAFALAHKGTPLSRKITKLLELVASRSKPGTMVQINPHTDAPLVDAESKTEMNFLLGHLEKIGLVRALPGGGNYLMEIKGWEQIEASNVSGAPGKCFVAMSFHPSLDEAYKNGIYLAVKEDCKMEPVRVDLVQHNEKICDKIIAEIRTCQFLLADVTLQRAGVYFEAGFAMGLGRPVIWSCRKDDLKKVHFDTRQYNHIVWREPGELRTQLADRIKATIPDAV